MNDKRKRTELGNLGLLKRKAVVVIGALAILEIMPAHTAQAQNLEALTANNNPAIIRWSSGKFVYREGPERNIRGYEEWRMTVAPDGSRTLDMWYNITKDHLSTVAIYRLDSDFNPLSLYKSSWVDANNTVLHSVVDGLNVNSTVLVNGETTQQEVTAQGPFSITVSPIAADALHFARYDHEKGGVQKWIVLGTVAAGAEDTDIGKRVETKSTNIGANIFGNVSIEYIGQEQVTVAAGTFVTDHFRMGEMIDMWVYGADYTLIRYDWHPNEYSYELVEYSHGGYGESSISKHWRE